MLKRSVIAANITNLTDARYFASMGVDYLMYNPSEIGIVEIGAIQEWVEGVKTLVFMDQDNVHLIEEVLIRLKPTAVGAADKNTFEKIMTYISEGQVFYHFNDSDISPFVLLTDVDNIDASTLHISNSKEVITFSDRPFTSDSMTAFLAVAEKNIGVVLRGSIEEETGLKSYEDIDEVLEILEDLD